MAPPDTSRHWALIVGIDRYLDRSITPLTGARRDAQRFYEWITDPAGGGVPTANVIRLPGPAAEQDPTIEEIEKAFLDLCRPAAKTRYAGQRLYIFLSGHGVAQGVHEASLLAADGSEQAQDRHVPGWHWLNWFLQAGYFDEVVLFADCCRTVAGTWAVRRFPLAPINRGRPKQVHWVRGFAVQYGGKAIEKQGPDGGRGVFTKALLDALEHARRADGTVTAHSMSDYLFNHPDLARWRDRQAPSIVSDGDVVFSARPQPLRNGVVISVQGDGQPTIQGGPRQAFWEVHPDGPGRFRASLPRGLYAVRVPGRETVVLEILGGARNELHLSI